MAEKKNKPKPENIETVPDAWERFEKAIDTVTHTAPKPNKGKLTKPADHSRNRKR